MKAGLLHRWVEAGQARVWVSELAQVQGYLRELAEPVEV